MKTLFQSISPNASLSSTSKFFIGVSPKTSRNSISKERNASLSVPDDLDDGLDEFNQSEHTSNDDKIVEKDAVVLDFALLCSNKSRKSSIKTAAVQPKKELRRRNPAIEEDDCISENSKNEHSLTQNQTFLCEREGLISLQAFCLKHGRKEEEDSVLKGLHDEDSLLLSKRKRSSLETEVQKSPHNFIITSKEENLQDNPSSPSEPSLCTNRAAGSVNSSVDSKFRFSRVLVVKRKGGLPTSMDDSIVSDNATLCRPSALLRGQSCPDLEEGATKTRASSNTDTKICSDEEFWTKLLAELMTPSSSEGDKVCGLNKTEHDTRGAYNFELHGTTQEQRKGRQDASMMADGNGEALQDHIQ